MDRMDQLVLFDWKQSPPLAPVRTKTRPWTPPEKEKLAALYLDGDMPDVQAIADVLGRSYSKVANMASRMGLSFTRRGPNAELRACIRRCGRDFWSESFSNRVCPQCKRSKEYMECA